MSEEQKRVSLLKVETGWARFKWKPFNIKFRFWTSRTETFGHRFRLDLFDFEIFGWSVFLLILWLFQIVGFHWIEDWFSFEIRFSRERIQICESWEPWSSIKLESTFCLVFVLDSLMAEQQPQNTAIVEEKKVPPTDEVEEGPESKAESPVPPVAKASTPELTESPEVVAAMTVELTTAKTETDALVGAIKEISDSLEGVEGQEGTSKLIKVMLLGLKAQRSIHREAVLRWSRLPRSNWICWGMWLQGFQIRLRFCRRSVMILEPISISWPRALWNWVMWSRMATNTPKMEEMILITVTGNFLKSWTPRMSTSFTSGMASIVW